MSERLKILLTNDDGYKAPGLGSLHTALSTEYDVFVVAPEHEQSGIGHAFTFNRPLHYAKLPDSLGMVGYRVTGTPSDCVKFGISHLLHAKPDLVVSGLNSGENSGISGHYSGTVAAAREGAFWRVPSVAFSVSAPTPEFVNDYCRKALDILKSIVRHGPESNGPCIFYNVNFPDCSPASCKGVKVTRQSMAFFDDRYRRVVTEGAPDGYIVYGEKKDVETLDTFDSRALLNNYITVTPLCFDATAEWALPLLSDLETLR